jgi:EmrB/QacA subfamily drug resistance transporter
VINELSSLDVRSTSPRSLRRAYQVLVVVFVADLMDMLDSTVANLAGPSIRADLGGDETTLQWVLAAYTLTFALGLVTAGRLGDLFGRRRLFLIGMAGFTLASLACGLAPGVGWLITARAVQGLFGSVMIPQGFALLTVVFPPDKLRQAFVPFGPIMGLASVGGPILAGWLLHVNPFGSEWRSIFLINVPIGIAAWLLSWRYLPRHTGEDRNTRLDITGVTLLTLASALLIVPLVEGREFGWPTWTYVMMAGSVVALALFVVSERRSTHPVIAPSLFRKRSFVVGLVIVAGFFAAQNGFLLAFNLLLQLGLHWSPLDSGLALIPWAVGSAVGVGLAGAVLVAKLGRATLQLGLGCAAAGLIALCWTIVAWHDHLTAINLTPALLAIGFGTGLVGVPIFEYVLGDSTTAEVGTGSGMLNAVQQFASAIGFAALGTVFFAKANHGTYHEAGVLVSALAAALFLITLLLIGLLPKQPRSN